MEQAEGILSFDFEGGLEPTAAEGIGGWGAAQAETANYHNNVRPPSPLLNQKAWDPKNYRRTVCRHWLRGLCMKGDACEFLHQFDEARMPVCQFFARFGECQESHCVYKHTTEDITECHLYKLGFCPKGPACRYRHEKLPGPPPSFEQNLHKIKHRGCAPKKTTTRHGKPRTVA